MELAAAPAAPETLQPPQPDYEASKPKKEDYTDNKEYRRDYKRWHTFKTRDQEYSAKRQRELDENSCLQSVLDAEPDQPRFKKPRGRAPLADGVPCTWDGERGYWVTASGAHHDVAALRKATTAEYFSAMKLPDAEVQEQRRSDCARVAAAVEARLAPSASLLERLQKEETARAVPPEAPADFYALAGARRRRAFSRRRARRECELMRQKLDIVGYHVWWRRTACAGENWFQGKELNCPGRKKRTRPGSSKRLLSVPRHGLAVGLHGLGMPPHCPRVMQGCRTSSSWPLEARFAHAPELLVLPDGTVVLPLQLVDLREAR